MVQIPKGIHLSFSISTLLHYFSRSWASEHLAKMCGTLQCRCVGLWCCHAALSDVNGSGKVPFEFGRSGEDWRL